MTLRIKHLSVSGFRGFGRSVDLDLDGDVIVISGVNGSGKTSLMDSILWVLSGAIPRLGKDAEVVSRYSATGEARVEIVLGGHDGATMRIVRRHDGASESLAVQTDGGEHLRGPSAEGELLQALWPDAQLAQNPWEALARSLTRAVYLQQDAIRDFVEAEGEEERFRAVGEIVGAGRASELNSQLATARNRWSRSSTSLEREAGPRRARLAELRTRALALDEVDIDVEELNNAWTNWVRAARIHREVGPERRARLLDRALGALQTEEDRLQRVADGLTSLQAALASPIPDPAEDLKDRSRHLEQTREALTDARERLKAAQAGADDERRRLLEAAEVSEQLAAMASIALNHLHGECPVCGQDHDQAATSKRLNAYVDSAGAKRQTPAAATGVSAAAGEVRELERSERELVEAVRRLQAQREQHARWVSQVSRLAEENGLSGEGLTQEAVQYQLQGNSRRVAELSELRRTGEQLGLSLARLDERSQRAALDSQIHELEVEVARLDAELAARTETYDISTQLLDALRTASEELIKAELAAMEPLLQRIYSSVDPHPSFKAVNFLTRTVRGKGRLWTPVADIDAEQSVNEPSTVLSSSQLNVLAVSAFLALNLSVASLPLDVVALDDPLQSLDDVNLLGLADLVRRIRGRRQVIVSTHDDRLSALLRRKLRPVRDGERTLQVDLAGWTRSGPTVEVGEVRGDVSPLRLVG